MKAKSKTTPPMKRWISQLPIQKVQLSLLSSAAQICSLALAMALFILNAACSHSKQESLQRAARAWDAKEYQVAADEYEHFLAAEPAGEESLNARLRLANIYLLNLKRYDSARAHYLEFLNQDGAHADAPLVRERLAESLAELGRSYEAIAEYELLHPHEDHERRRIRLRIADLYMEQRDFNQALTEYEKVIEKADYDDLTELAYLREAAIYHHARRQYQQALPIYQKIAAQTGDAKTVQLAMYGIADCFAGLYEFDDAIKTLRTVSAPSEQSYIAKKIADWEEQKREAAQARSKVQERPVSQGPTQ